MRQLLSSVEEFFPHPQIFFLAIVSTVLQIILFPPFYVYKKCVIIYVKYFSSLNLGEPLNAGSTLHADIGYFRGSILIGVLKVKGKNLAQTIEEIIEKKVLQMKLKNSQKLRYSHLTQYPYSFMGYWFWKNDESFSIKNHVKKGSDQNEKFSISFAHQHGAKAPFVENRSPWDITVFENESEFSTIVVRVHHSLGDGKSLVKFIVEGLGQKKLHSVEAKKGVETLSWIQLPLFPLYLLKYNFDILLLQNRFQKHPWKMNPTDKLPDVIQFSQEFSMSSIKSASKKFNNARTSAILLAAISQASLKFIHANYQNLTNWSNLPILFVLPKENHPEYFKNHSSDGNILSPGIGLEDSDLVNECGTRFTALRENSIEPIIRDKCMEIVSTFVQALRVNLPAFCAYVFAITNIAGEKEQIQIGNSPCEDFSLSVVVTGTSLGVLIVVFSYMDKIRFTVNTKETVLDERRCQRLIGLLEQEMIALLR